jgi:N-acetylmuramoyl-L-alanine amidase
MALAAPVGSAQAQELRVTDMRIGVHSDKTRFVLELSADVEFKIIKLADPYRLVIDIPETDWRLAGGARPAGLIQGLRYGQFSRGVSRLVLDVKGPVEVGKAFLILPASGKPYRLVIDLIKTDTAHYKAGLSRPSSRPAQGKAGPVPFKLMPPARKPALKTAKRIITLDPGHGGVDPGATGPRGVFEKIITLAVAREIKKRLEVRGKYKVVLTRSGDSFVRLRDRIAIARQAGAQLFISLHADAIRRKGVRGLSVYTLSEKASDKEAAELAEQENKADLIAGMDLSAESTEVTNILIDLAQRETMNSSARFAGNLVKQLRGVTKLLRNSHRFAGFAVLKAPDVPSVLIEMGFLSNPKDAKALRQARFRAKLAGAIGRAVDNYFARIEQANRSGP